MHVCVCACACACLFVCARACQADLGPQAPRFGALIHKAIYVSDIIAFAFCFVFSLA